MSKRLFSLSSPYMSQSSSQVLELPRRVVVVFVAGTTAVGGVALRYGAVGLHGGMIAAFQKADSAVRFVFTIRKSVGHP